MGEPDEGQQQSEPPIPDDGTKPEPPSDPGGMQDALEAAAAKGDTEAVIQEFAKAPLGLSADLKTGEVKAIDSRGSAFDPRVHAQKEDGSPKTDSFGNFIKRELDYVAHPFAHFADTFRHVPEKK